MTTINMLTSGLIGRQSPIRYISPAPDVYVEPKVSPNFLFINDRRYWELVEKTASCWFWRGIKKTTGYGVFSHHQDGRARLISAHRLSWVLANGSIPQKMQVLHRCDTPLCVNPAHLFLGTDADNHQDKAAKGRHWQQKKTHCPQGHAYTPENTLVNDRGHRRCKTCKTGVAA